MTADETRSTVTELQAEENVVASYRPGEDESITEAVVAAVSAASRTDPTELAPLYAVIAPDALDALFDSRAGGRAHGNDAFVTFEYESYRVRVENGDRITLY